MARVNVAVVHGIGVNRKGYADHLIKGARAEFNRTLREMLKSPADFSDEIHFIPVIWDDIMAYQEAVLADIMRKEFEKRRKKGLAGVFQDVFGVPRRFIVKLRTDFAAEFIGDITGYRDRGTVESIFRRIKDSLQPLADLPGRENVSFISHSLGTVIASDFVWEEEKSGRMLGEKIFLSNFFTMGSPLPLFSLQFGGADVFNKPIALQDDRGRWVNIFDKDDPIAYPLKPLNAAYDKAVLKDQEVSVGLFGIAHVKYWESRRVHSIIARKLALDWLRFNGKLDKPHLDDLYALYDGNTGV